MYAYDQYVENSVLTATPLQLVTLLYRCALDAIAEARKCLQAGDIEGRVKPVNRAFDAVTELTLSLDYEKGGELSVNLGELYGYITNQLVVGHCNQSDAHFAEAARLLATLLESWEEIASRPELAATGTNAGAAAA